MRAFAAVGLALALSGCHSQSDAGAFRVGTETIAPAGNVVWRRLVSRKPVLLTFDDGPEDERSDRAILSTLEKHHALALWLVTCKTLDPSLDRNAKRHRAVLQDIVRAGHLLGNHGYSHIDLRPLAAGQRDREIAGCSALIEGLTGTRPRYFRPPWGLSSPRVSESVNASGMQMLLWSSNSYDSLMVKFKIRPELFAPFVAKYPAYDVALNASAGDVILFHDYPNTALALDGILSRLEQRGFQFVVPGGSESRRE